MAKDVKPETVADKRSRVISRCLGAAFVVAFVTFAIVWKIHFTVWGVVYCLVPSLLGYGLLVITVWILTGAVPPFIFNQRRANRPEVYENEVMIDPTATPASWDTGPRLLSAFLPAGLAFAFFAVPVIYLLVAHDEAVEAAAKAAVPVHALTR